MQRRLFLKTAAGAVALGATANLAHAGDSVDGLIVTNEITNNHGHEVNLNLSDLVLLLREADQHGIAQVDIQGLSGHPHTIELDKMTIETILVDGSEVITSSEDFGHAHEVTIHLN